MSSSAASLLRRALLLFLSIVLFVLYYYVNVTVQPLPARGEELLLRERYSTPSPGRAGAGPPAGAAGPLLLANRALHPLHWLNLQALVQPVVKRVLKAALLGLCQRFSLRCWLNLGTLVGSWRGGRVLDWDRDADIGILREDFIRLEEIVRRGWKKAWSSQHETTTRVSSASGEKAKAVGSPPVVWSSNSTTPDSGRTGDPASSRSTAWAVSVIDSGAADFLYNESEVDAQLLVPAPHPEQFPQFELGAFAEDRTGGNDSSASIASMNSLEERGLGGPDKHVMYTVLGVGTHGHQGGLQNDGRALNKSHSELAGG